MSSKHDLIHSIIMTVKHKKDSSFNTRNTRKKRLLLIAEQLAEGGYKIAHIQQRQYVTNKDKSIIVSDSDISKITDADVRMS